MSENDSQEEKIILRVSILKNEYDINDKDDPDNLINLIMDNYGLTRPQIVAVLKKSNFKNKAIKPKSSTLLKHLIKLADAEKGEYFDLDSIFGPEEDEEGESSGDEQYKTAIDKTVFDKSMLDSSLNAQQSKSSKVRFQPKQKYKEPSSLPESSLMQLMQQNQLILQEIYKNKSDSIRSSREDNSDAYNSVSTSRSSEAKIHRWLGQYPSVKSQTFECLPKITDVGLSALREMNINFIIDSLEQALSSGSTRKLKTSVCEAIPRLHALSVTSGMQSQRKADVKNVIAFIDSHEMKQKNSDAPEYLEKKEIDSHIFMSNMYKAPPAVDTQRVRRPFGKANNSSNNFQNAPNQSGAPVKICIEYNDLNCPSQHDSRCENGLHCCSLHYEKRNITKTKHPKARCILKNE